MFRLFKALVVSLMIGTTFSSQTIYTDDATFVEPPAVVEQVETIKHEAPIYKVKTVDKKIEKIKSKMIENEKVEELATQEEIELLALLVMAEAEGESEYGKRLVIDTVLNRVDSEFRYFEDSIAEVIYQPRQFSGMYGERITKCYVTEDNLRLVREELLSRTNYDVLYFHANHYGKYGTPLFSEGNHYFSG